MTTEEKLEEIGELLNEISNKEKKSNGFQMLLWIVQAFIAPGLLWCLFQISQINGNRYTIRDGAEHQKEHVQLERDIAQILAKLGGLPPIQIEKNKEDIERLKNLIRELEK